MVGPLLVRYKPGDLEFTVLRWLPGAFWYLLLLFRRPAWLRLKAGCCGCGEERRERFSVGGGKGFGS